MILVEGKIKVLVKKQFEYDTSDDRLPLVICNSCKRDLYRIKNDNQKTVKLPDFTNLTSLKKSTRSNRHNSCDCHICQLARKPSFNNFSNFAKNNVLPKRKSILFDEKNTTAPGKISIFNIYTYILLP